MLPPEGTCDYFVNAAETLESDVKAPDMHCPNIGTPGNNYWIDKCKARQKDPIHKGLCYPECIYSRDAEKFAKITKEIPSDTFNKILILYKKGMNIPEIANILSLTTRWVRTQVIKAQRQGDIPK